VDLIEQVLFLDCLFQLIEMVKPVPHIPQNDVWGAKSRSDFEIWTVWALIVAFREERRLSLCLW